MKKFIKGENNAVVNSDDQLYKKVINERNRKEYINELENDINELKDDINHIRDELNIIHQCININECNNEERLNKLEDNIYEIKWTLEFLE